MLWLNTSPKHQERCVCVENMRWAVRGRDEGMLRSALVFRIIWIIVNLKNKYATFPKERSRAINRPTKLWSYPPSPGNLFLVYHTHISREESSPSSFVCSRRLSLKKKNGSRLGYRELVGIAYCWELRLLHLQCIVCCKPSAQPRDAARREECSSLDEKSFTTFCRCDGRAKGIC